MRSSSERIEDGEPYFGYESGGGAPDAFTPTAPARMLDAAERREKPDAAERREKPDAAQRRERPESFTPPAPARMPDVAERRELLLQEMQMRKIRNKVRRKYMLMIFVSFLFAVALIYRYSLVIEINDHILREKVTLGNIENENSLLQKQIGSETDLEKIRILAESRLGMQKPDKDQIYYIKVPRRDHALTAPPQPRAAAALNPFEWLAGQIELVRKRLIAD